MSLSIGITCFPTFGGSGIVATEIGIEMARRGHRVHFICADLPRRLDVSLDNVFFHQVRARDYDVFPQVPYALALSSAIVSVATWEGLDLLHAHYAVPHATSGWMAREVLGGAMKVVTTLHGTDITLVGSDASYLPITRHSIQQSDAVTAPSEYLRQQTRELLDVDVPIEVIPNFVDTGRLRPAETWKPVLVHVSNFRALKRVDRVVDVFARVAAERPCRLLLIGDGPERPRVEAQIRRLGLTDRVRLLGSQTHFEDLLRECAVFLLPSEVESFGLAALEALACGVPVVASDVGGLPEVVRHGQTGFLMPPDDVDGMARCVVQILDGGGEMRARARADVVARFRTEPVADRYEALYLRVTGATTR